MKAKMTAAITAMAFGAALALPAAPAAAQLAASPDALGASGMARNLTTQVQGGHWRGGHWRGGHGGAWRRGHGGAWRHGGGHGGVGAGVAAGIAAGALVGGAIAAQRTRRIDPAIQYCIDRFRSYDIASQTYMGYDGRRHACP